jgi:photosystem II stability/assembly factor-like uncharacterized protein
MDTTLIVATGHGIVTYERHEHEWHALTHGLDGHNVTSAIAREGVILAGTTSGVFRSDDYGETWHAASSGLHTRHVRWMAFHPGLSDDEFVGTEPAAIFVSHNGGVTWRECPEVAQLRDEHGWMLPYSPEAGCVRGFTFHGNRAYAAVEVGGVLRSDDGGETWRLAEGSDGNPNLAGSPASLIYPDVHSIAAHPSAPDLVFAPTGGGFYRTRDGGKTWTLLYECYVRAVWLDGEDANHVILGPADGVDSQGRIEESHDGGTTWQVASDGLQVPWRRHMVERFEQVGEELFAVLSNGELLVAPPASLRWKRVLTELEDVHAVTSMKE